MPKHNISNAHNIPIEIYYPSLKKIESLRHRYATLKQRLHLQHWRPFYAKAAQLKEWWGYLKFPNNPRQLFIFHFDGEALSHNHIEKHSAVHIRTLSLEQLGLLVNAPLDEEALTTLKGRLAGSIPQVPRDQALCNDYLYCDAQSCKFGEILSECNETLERYIGQYMHERYPKESRYGLDMVSSLTINNRKYTALTKGFKTEIILYPDDSICEITEQDVLADEKAHPGIHGNTFSKIVCVNSHKRTKR